MQNQIGGHVGFISLNINEVSLKNKDECFYSSKKKNFMLLTKKKGFIN